MSEEGLDTATRIFENALVMDDDVDVARSLTDVLHTLGVEQVHTSGTIDEALCYLEHHPDLLLCDLRMGAQSGVRVIERARQLSPSPVLIAMSGAASRDEVFDLAMYGVAAFLDKPFTVARVQECLDRAALDHPLERIARSEVGRAGAKEAQQRLREAMFREALQRTRGNRHAAARLLKVDRRIVQLMAAALNIRERE